MRQGIRGPRADRRAKLMRALAEAKPTRLDPAAPPPVIWPPASHFTEPAGPRPASTSPDASTRAGRNRRPAPRQSSARRHWPPEPSPLRHKVLAAVSSAVAISAVLALAVTLGRGHDQQPARPATSHHKQQPGPPPTSHDVQPSINPIRFQALPLTRPWHGRIRFGVRAGVVYLAGFATIQARSSAAITVLPASVRPLTRLDIPIAAVPAAALTIQITPGGLVLLMSGHGVFHVGQIWLSGVSFPIRS